MKQRQQQNISVVGEIFRAGLNTLYNLLIIIRNIIITILYTKVAGEKKK